MHSDLDSNKRLIVLDTEIKSMKSTFDTFIATLEKFNNKIESTTEKLDNKLDASIQKLDEKLDQSVLRLNDKIEKFSRPSWPAIGILSTLILTIATWLYSGHDLVRRDIKDMSNQVNQDTVKINKLWEDYVKKDVK